MCRPTGGRGAACHCGASWDGRHARASFLGCDAAQPHPRCVRSGPSVVRSATCSWARCAGWEWRRCGRARALGAPPTSSTTPRDGVRTRALRSWRDLHDPPTWAMHVAPRTCAGGPWPGAHGGPVGGRAGREREAGARRAGVSWAGERPGSVLRVQQAAWAFQIKLVALPQAARWAGSVLRFAAGNQSASGDRAVGCYTMLRLRLAIRVGPPQLPTSGRRAGLGGGPVVARRGAAGDETGGSA
jgi:hypothetical protein